MLASILATKLHIPSPRSKAVYRPRLLEQLNEGLSSKLTLIAAAAGFGKTTLVSQWIAACDVDVAWLSLDEADNDSNRFLTYLVAALQTVQPHLGDSILAALQTTQPPPIESLLALLLNEITALPSKIALVLDDYHVIHAESVNLALIFLLGHLPAHLHLIITTRADPVVPLARLRARNQLTELRAADLRFTPEEAATFLNQSMGLTLPATDIAALEDRTEGWIAGLQLAALSLQKQTNTSQFIQAFTGSHRFILDYLVEEVLQRQPQETRSFLLKTAILQQLNGPLCDAVTEQTNGKAQLEALERDNLFIVPLDNQRQWYRYHHLFAEVLKARITEEQPAQMAGLHLRASCWYERHGSSAETVHHALAAEDFERAANLIELTWRDLTRCYQNAAVIGWMKALPEEIICARPVLRAGYAWALMASGELDAMEPHIQALETWLVESENASQKVTPCDHTPPLLSPNIVVANDTEYQSLPATLAIARAYQSQTLGDFPRSVEYAQRALENLPPEDYIRRAVPTSLLGLAHWANGDLEAAHRSFSAVVTSFQRAGAVLNTLDLRYTLAEIRAAQGRLNDAFHIYRQVLQIADEHSEESLRGPANACMGMSELQCEWNQLETAARTFQTGKSLNERAVLPDWQHRWRIAQARIKAALGDFESAIALLDEAERLYYPSPIPDVRPIAALRAQAWIRQGQLNAAWTWAKSQNLSLSMPLSYLRECEHITFARLLIAEYRQNEQETIEKNIKEKNNNQLSIHEILDFLERLLTAARSAERMRSEIEILILQALAHPVESTLSVVLPPLQQALRLAEPEGYVRLFVAEGPPMARLLQEAAKNDISLGYVRRLQSAFEKGDVIVSTHQSLDESLSDRELEVLRQLNTELSGPEISRHLIVSLNTLRTHTKHIYNKLGVNNRRAAVRRAKELGLL